ncbi:peptide ABC transporter permease [Gemmatimonadetes bacterium T265]|nr:peptide ABC transporter permease [Gemmatimonadetes bacterium T265]
MTPTPTVPRAALAPPFAGRVPRLAAAARARPSFRMRAAGLPRLPWTVWLAGGTLAAFAAVALLAPRLAPYDPARQFDLVALQNRAPSAAHPFGTDPFARDVLSRTLYAARTSLGVAALAAAVATALGVLVGGVAGALGGRTERLLMRTVDAVLGVPRVLLLLAVVALWAQIASPVLAVVLGLTAWPGTSRLVRARVAAVRRAEWVEAARALGASPARVLFRHLPPHVVGTVGVAATLLFGELLALEAGLSFLGLGVRPPDASWGSMVQDGAGYVADAPWTVAAPTACVVLCVLAASVLGDWAGDRARGDR